MLYLQTATGKHEVGTAHRLRDVVQELLNAEGNATYWLFDDDEMVGAFFFNGEHACVYRNRDGMWSHNPENSEDEVAPFILENGQLDEFPISHCIEFVDALDAFVKLARTGELSSRIAWY